MLTTIVVQFCAVGSGQSIVSGEADVPTTNGLSRQQINFDPGNNDPGPSPGPSPGQRDYSSPKSIWLPRQQMNPSPSPSPDPSPSPLTTRLF